MTGLSFEKMWSFMKENELVVNRSVVASENVKCVLCHQLLIEPKQAPCECRFCGKCISEYLCAGGNNNNSEKICPGGTKECAEEYLFSENITNDYVTNRKISKMRMKCPNETCLFEDVLLNMNDHWRDCTRGGIDTILDCPYGQLGCGIMRCDRRQMIDHLQLENYEHCQMMIQSVENLRNEIDIVRRENECLRMGWTKQQGEIERLSERISELSCEGRDDKETKETNEDFFCKDTESNCSDEIDEALNMHKEYVWVIHSFSIVKKSSNPIDSRQFRTHHNGYNMQLRMIPSSFWKLEGAGLSFYPNCVKGTFDQCLQWPVTMTITISIVKKWSGATIISETRDITYYSSNKSHNSSFFFPFNKGPLSDHNCLTVKCFIQIVS